MTFCDTVRVNFGVFPGSCFTTISALMVSSLCSAGVCGAESDDLTGDWVRDSFDVDCGSAWSSAGDGRLLAESDIEPARSAFIASEGKRAIVMMAAWVGRGGSRQERKVREAVVT